MTLLDSLLEILHHIHNGSPFKSTLARWLARIAYFFVGLLAVYVFYVTYLRGS